MIDLTPLDVRKKKGDFRRALRGYESQVVDDFLDLVAERLEELVRENGALRERAAQLADTVAGYRERERAMNEALVTAQQMREELRAQAAREAELALREARSEAEQLLAQARRQVSAAAESTRRLYARRAKFLRSFRAFLEREMGDLEVEEERVRESAREEEVVRWAGTGGGEDEVGEIPEEA